MIMFGFTDAPDQSETLAGLADEIDHAFRELDGRAAGLLKLIKGTAASLPASQETDVLIKVIDDIEVRQRTVDLPPVEIIGELRRVVQGPTVIYLPEQKIFGELQEWIDEVDETTKQKIPVIVEDREKVLEAIQPKPERAGGRREKAQAEETEPEREEPVPTAMEMALRQAMDRAKTTETPEAFKKRRKGSNNELENILERTLKHKVATKG